MALAVDIDGVDRVAYLAEDTLDIQQEATTHIATCNFGLNDPLGALTITAKLVVYIHDGTDNYFHGAISHLTVEQMTPNNQTAVRYYIRCQDDNLELDKRIVENKTYTLAGDTSDIERIDDLFASYYSSGIDYSTYVIGTALIDPMEEQEFLCITLREAIRQICDQTGANFYVHYDDGTLYFHYYVTEALTSAWSLTDDNPNGSTTFGYIGIEKEIDATMLINAVYLVGGDYWATWRTDATSISAYTRHESALVASLAASPTAGDTMGDQILDLYDTPRTIYRVTCRHGTDLRAGMRINLVWTPQSINSTFVINRLRVYHAGGELRFELSLHGRELEAPIDVNFPVPNPAPVGGISSIVLSTAHAEGDSTMFLRTDATVLAFDATNPTTIECDDAAVVGVIDLAARRDHGHAIVCAAASTLTITTVNAEGSAASFARSDHLHELDATVAGSAITITAGDGLTGGGDLTANRTITMGTPGTLTASTTNGVSATSHLHTIDSTLARSAITITAGSGLTGGGNLTANRTINMGTPGTLTVSTTNGTTSSSHLHTITTSSNPGAAAAILATDANGYLQLVRLGLGRSPLNPLDLYAASGTVQMKIQSDDGSVNVILDAAGVGDAAVYFLDDGVDRWRLMYDVSDAGKLKVYEDVANFFALSISPTTGRIGVKLSDPYGLLHGYDTIGGFLHWEYDGVGGTARTIIPNNAGDVQYIARVISVVRASNGATSTQTLEIANGGSATAYDVGGDTLTIAVSAIGVMTAQRTAGALTYKVALWVTWL